MSKPVIFITERGNVSPKYLKDLRDAGIIVVAAKDVKKARFVRPEYEVPANDLLAAAVAAIEADPYDSSRQGFARNVAKMFMRKNQNDQPKQH